MNYGTEANPCSVPPPPEPLGPFDHSIGSPAIPESPTVEEYWRVVARCDSLEAELRVLRKDHNRYARQLMTLGSVLGEWAVRSSTYKANPAPDAAAPTVPTGEWGTSFVTR